MSFFRRKPLADVNQQAASPAAEGKAKGFFSNKPAPQPLGPIAQKENDPTQAGLVQQQHESTPVQAGNPPVKPADNPAPQSSAASDAPSMAAAPPGIRESSNLETKSVLPPRPKLQASGSASPLFRASFENRVISKRPRDQAPKPEQPAVTATMNFAAADSERHHESQPQKPQQQNHAMLANEPKLKSPRKGSSRRSVSINPGLSTRGPSFEDSFNKCWDVLESNREAMGSIRSDLMDARLLLANRCTDLLKEDVAPTLGPRLLDCMARVQEIRKRIGKPRPKTQYWPVAPPAVEAPTTTQAPAVSTSA